MTPPGAGPAGPRPGPARAHGYFITSYLVVSHAQLRYYNYSFLERDVSFVDMSAMLGGVAKLLESIYPEYKKLAKPKESG